MKILIEEAKAADKICQMSFGTHEDGWMRCQGASCMAWRWALTHIKPPKGGNLVSSDDTHGFCGMAGVPGQF